MRQIKNVMENPDDVDNPISVSFELKAMRESGDPTSEILADIQEKLTTLEGSVDKIEADISNFADSESVDEKMDKIDSINTKLNILIKSYECEREEVC